VKRKLPHVLSLFAAALLFVAVVLVCVPLFAFRHPQLIREPLDSLIAADVEGWQEQKLEIADSAEMRSRVTNILQFDDVLFRDYRRGGTEVQIYVAYWKPGTVPYGQAGVHTPDTCWIVNGWTQDERQHAQPLTVGRWVTKPAETGRFSMRGQKLDVIFWHLVGGQVHSYEQYGWLDGAAGARERLPHLFQDLRRFGLNLAQEQLFVRISSNVPLETLLKEPAFTRLLETLRPLGVFEGQKA
jgi:hypothetical protein